MNMMLTSAIRPVVIIALAAMFFGPVAAQTIPVPGAAPEVAAPQVEDGASGDATASRLDALYEQLGKIETEKQAEPVVAEIRSLWGRSGSDSMDLLLDRARKAMSEEDYPRATSHVRALTRLAPDFAEGWNASATLHYLQKDYWQAVEDIEAALRLEPRHFNALTGLALILEQVDRKAAALRTWREVTRLYPGLDAAREAIDRLAPEVDGRDI